MEEARLYFISRIGVAHAQVRRRALQWVCGPAGRGGGVDPRTGPRGGERGPLCHARRPPPPPPLRPPRRAALSRQGPGAVRALEQPVRGGGGHEPRAGVHLRGHRRRQDAGGVHGDSPPGAWRDAWSVFLNM
eukprot:1180532-Prorocentrum_minimum.AAC.3